MLLQGSAAAVGTGSCCQGGQGPSQAEEGLARALVMERWFSERQKSGGFLFYSKPKGLQVLLSISPLLRALHHLSPTVCPRPVTDTPLFLLVSCSGNVPSRC